ncbi:MAG TPA: CBS domain-containing protein [Acidimicrobiia bacterium]|nr:CBS domain-containing protein [Acidimicrobiia bacterium]
MKIANVLDTKGSEVVTIGPEASVVFAVHEFSSRGIGALVVTEDGNRVEGVISERDVTRGLARHGSGVLSLRVREVMSRHVPACRPGDSTAECMAAMTRSRQRHLPVLDDGRLCGLVSIGDLVKGRLDELELERNVMRQAYIARR